MILFRTNDRQRHPVAALDRTGFEERLWNDNYQCFADPSHPQDFAHTHLEISSDISRHRDYFVGPDPPNLAILRKTGSSSHSVLTLFFSNTCGDDSQTPSTDYMLLSFQGAIVDGPTELHRECERILKSSQSLI
jgi:hypothetical protein